jgi:hypothetical protein
MPHHPKYTNAATTPASTAANAMNAAELVKGADGVEQHPQEYVGANHAADHEQDVEQKLVGIGCPG